MSAGPLSPVMMIASAGLFQNTGLDVNPGLVTQLAAYNATTVAAAFTAVVNKAIALNATFSPTDPAPPPAPGDPPNPPYEPTPDEVTVPFSNATLIALQRLAGDSVPALSNVIPDQYFNSYVPPLWDEEEPYQAGSQVTYFGQIWLATLPNIGVVPVDFLLRFEEEPEEEKPTWIVLQANLLMSTSVNSMARRIMGYDVTDPASGPDVSKFAQVLALSRGFSGSVNQFMGSINNSDQAAATFTDMDTISTGGLSQVSNNPQLFSADTQQIGNVVNLSQLALLGFPSMLLFQIFENGGLIRSVLNKFVAAGVTLDQFETMSSSPELTSADINRRLYSVMVDIRNDELAQIMELLDVSVSGITSMADLLNPLKLLPGSYATLTTPGLDGKPVVVYAGNVPGPAAIAALITDTVLPDLSLVIPPDQAAANRAWARGLGQIKGVASLEMPALAVAAAFVETNAARPLVKNMTSPVPDDVKNTLKNALAPSNITPTATGDGGTMTTMDLVGTAAGEPHVASLTAITPIINRLQSTAQLTALNSAYTVMNSVLNGAFGPVDTGPITGLPAPFNSGEPFDGADDCFVSSLIPQTQTIIDAISAANPAQAAVIQPSWDAMGAQIARESINQRGAEINFAALTPNNKNAIMGLTTSLHDLGSDIAGGTALFFQGITGTGSRAGQALLSSLGEGRNIKVLQNIGVIIDTNLPNK